MKIYISSNFNLMQTNQVWDKLNKDHEVKFGNYNDILFILQNEKLVNDNDFIVSVFYINDYSISDIKEIWKIINKSAKKNLDTFFLVKIFIQKFENLAVDHLNNFKKVELAYNLFKKKNSNVFTFFYPNNKSFFSVRNKFIIRCPLSHSGLKNLASDVYKSIQLINTKPFKLIILDCDNTLWGGVAGEDGIEKIKYGEDGEGKIFQNIQKHLKNLKTKGFVLSIASKNNENLVWETMKKRKMVLQKKDFLFSKINWKEKSSNIQQSLSEINIKEDDVLFIDDSSLERAKVRKTFKKISILNSSDTENYLSDLLKHERLQKYKIIKEDKKKYSQYKLKNKYEIHKKLNKGIDLKNFLKKLNQKIIFHKVDTSNIFRTEQLLNKTNQFNFTSNRYNQKQIKKILKNKNKTFQLFSLKDKFGDHGIIGLIIYFKLRDTLIVTDFLISCRVISRKIEEFIIFKILRSEKKKQLNILFNQNSKNKVLIRNFLHDNKFILAKTNSFKKILNEKNTKVYSIKINNELMKINEYFKK